MVVRGKLVNTLSKEREREREKERERERESSEHEIINNTPVYDLYVPWHNIIMT